MTGSDQERQKLSATEVMARKRGPKLAMVTAYDYLIAQLAEAAGIDMILVGDSLGMVVLGYDSTMPVTMEDIIHHTRAARRGAPRTHIVADLPFLSYHLSDAQAIENAGRLVKEGGADSVKLEGGVTFAQRIHAIVSAGIPVVGHVGLLPQTASFSGGFKVRGRTAASAMAIIEDAQAVADAGACAMVVEAVPADVGRLITERVAAPTIGIGAGPECDGQVLVSTDMLGIDAQVTPKFVKRYAELGATIKEAFRQYAAEVQHGSFPDETHSFALKPDVATALRAELGGESSGDGVDHAYPLETETAGSNGGRHP